MLQRHGNRYHTSGTAGGGNDERFLLKVANSNSTHTGDITGPLDGSLDIYFFEMSKSYLMGVGASTNSDLGMTFWNRYDRTLYIVPVGQLA